MEDLELLKLNQEASVVFDLDRIANALEEHNKLLERQNQLLEHIRNALSER